MRASRAARTIGRVQRGRATSALGALLIGVAVAFGSSLTSDAVAVHAAIEPMPARESDAGRGELFVEARDADTMQPLAVRVRITPRAPFGDEQVRVSGDGRVRTELPAGSYRVYATHGPAYAIAEAPAEVRGGARTTLRVRLAREVTLEGYTACDLHVHTAESPDSDLPLPARIASLRAEDVQFAVITDHNRVTDATRALADAGIGSLPGVEVTTWDPEFGHFNVFPRTTAPRYRKTSAHELLRALRAEPETFVQVNHPRLEHHIGYLALAGFDRARVTPRALSLAFDALEVWNGYDLGAAHRRDEVFADWLALIARGHRISATGGSDSHREGRAPVAGYPRTYARVPRHEARDGKRVLAALKRGQSFVSNGPLIDLRVRGRGPGDTLLLGASERSVQVDVEVDAPRWMALTEVALWAGERRIARAGLPALPPEARSRRARVSLRAPIGLASSLLATVSGDVSMKPLLGRTGVTPHAFTSPIWIERH